MLKTFVNVILYFLNDALSWTEIKGFAINNRITFTRISQRIRITKYKCYVVRWGKRLEIKSMKSLERLVLIKISGWPNLNANF